jgi:exoribonuclease-2
MDLRALETFTIDDQKTRDMDDALSLERTPHGFRLGIHITDVASYLSPGTPLERETARRATSVYCPEQSIHMLPPEISESRLSLIAGSDRLALSCLLEVSPNFEIISSQFQPSIINSKRRLTYDEADDLLEHGDELLTDLFNIASCHEETRLREGGARIEKRDAQIVVQEDGEMKLIEIDEASASRSLIAEMMVLYNALIANYCTAQNLAIPFRSQEAPDNEQAPPLDAGPAYDFAIRSRLKRSIVADTPGLHYTLGLQRYTQATSPLRRYLDLCTQRQVLSFLLTGTAAYSREEMIVKISESEQPLGRANAASREARRFWFLAYLCERAKTNNKIGATILRIDDRGVLLELDETYMTATTRQAPGLRVGQHIQVKILKSEPFGDYLRLELI